VPEAARARARAHARYHVAIRRPADDAVLVLADGSMPGFSLADPPVWQVVTPVVERMADDFGLGVVALRAAWLGEPRSDGTHDRLYEATHVGGALPSGARWVALPDLERRPSPLGRAVDAGCLASASGDRQPWYVPGWMPEMAAWIDDGLGRAGLVRRGPIRQVRSWGRAALLTVETDRGRVWAKQVPDVFAHEVAVTRLLADIDPGLVPPAVATDPVIGRMLMEHIDGPLLPELRDEPDAWIATLARLAESQHVLAADLAAIRSAGVPAAALGRSADAVPGLVTDRDVLLVGRDGGLTTPEADRLADATEALVHVTRALAAAGPGPSLEHGDLSPGQVILGEMGPVILDWSDATITHPFLAAASFLMDAADVPADTAIHDAMIAAYLAPWGGGSDVARALDLARIVGPLHLAALYRDRILPGLEQPWEMERMVPAALRSLLPRLDDLPRILGR
jgi:hypothetical protein